MTQMNDLKKENWSPTKWLSADTQKLKDTKISNIPKNTRESNTGISVANLINCHNLKNVRFVDGEELVFVRKSMTKSTI